MPMIPPLVRDAPPDGRQSSTARPVSARLVRTQLQYRQYASGFNVSYVYAPPKPIPRPGPTPESPFDKWRAAAAEIGLPDDGASGPPGAAAGGEAPAPGVSAAPRRRLHDALLGSTALVLLGVLGGIGYLVWSGAVPGVLAQGGTVATGVGAPALAQSAAESDAGTVARAAADGAPPRPPPARDAALDVAAAQPAATLRLVPAVPAGPATAAPWAGKPVLAGQPPPASGVPAMAADILPDLATGPALPARPPAPDAPADAPPATPADAGPALEQAVAAVPPAPPSELGAALPGATPPAALTVLPADAPRVDAVFPAPAIAVATVRLPPTPEWAAPALDLASLSEAVAPASSSAVPEDPAPSVDPVAPVAAEAGRTAAKPGADAQPVVSTMALVRRMSLLVHDLHDDGLRFRTEMTALSGAVQAKASGLEERLKLAEARSGGGSGADAGGQQGGLPVSGVAGEGGVPRGGAGVPQVLRGYRVQAGSPGAVVLSEAGGGVERLARRLVMVGDQLPGAGRVTAIMPRGRSWMVRTERGVIE